MLERFRSDKIIWIFSVVVILIFVALVATDNRVVTHELHMVTLSEVDELRMILELELEGELQEGVDDLTLLAKYISADYDASEDIIEYLVRQSQVEEFEELYYVSLSGRGVSPKGTIFDFSQNSTFTKALINECAISSPFISQNSGDSVVEIAVPVTKNGAVTAVLICESPVSDIFQEWSDNTNQKAQAYISNGSGEILFGSPDSHQELRMLFEEDGIALTDSEIDSLLEDINSGVAGSIEHGTDDHSMLMMYSPVEMTDFSLILTTDKNTVYSDLTEAVEDIIQASMAVVFILLLFSVYTWYRRKAMIVAVESGAYIDQLTELPNSVKLKKDMHETLRKNKNKRFSIVKIDIENFKAINELFGFGTANQILKTFKTIRDTVDEPTLVISRTGADEFVLFSGNGFLDDMEERTQLYESYYNELIPELGNYHLSFKYGRYHIPVGDTDVDDIMNKVNMAHTMAKDNKDMVICDYDDNYKQQLLKMAEITSKMKNALENKEFKTFLQPKFDILDNRMIGAEALVRWIEDDGNMIFPDKFIPLFEKNGFIVELDKYMFNSICEIMRDWIDTYGGCVPVSVNCSRLNITNPNFVDEVREIADKYSIPHHYIEIELTESTMIEEVEIIENLFKDLHKLGFRISIDDFGSGFSSLGLLKNLTADILKLDKTFFHDKKDLVRGDLIIEGIVKLAQSLSMFVVAEGIEEPEQLELLRFVGCDAAQGYLYSKPISTAAFTTLFSEDIANFLVNDAEQRQNMANAKTVDQKLEMALTVLNAFRTPTTLFNESFTELKCNTSMLELFELDSPYQWSALFYNLSPEYQPDGALSSEKIMQNISVAKEKGEVTCSWAHCMLDGSEIPCEITINKLHMLDHNGEELFVCIIHDLRGHLAAYEMDADTLESGFFFNKITDKTLFNVITDLSFEWFFNYDILNSNIQFFGKGSENMPLPKGKQTFPDDNLFKTLVHADDKKEFDDFVADMKNGIENTHEIRLVSQTGEVKYHRFIYKAIKSEKGVPIFAIGKTFDISDQKSIDSLVQKDILTNCYNRISTENLIKKVLEQAPDTSHALFVIDIDNFESINENLGHTYGDNVLREVADNLRGYFREGDIIGRIGDDDFLVFLKNVDNKGALIQKAEGITNVLKGSYSSDTGKYKLSGSVGVARFLHDANDYDELLKTANIALRQAQAAGKGSYKFYEDGND